MPNRNSSQPSTIQYSRRQFIASASAAAASLFCLPRSVFAESPSDVVLRAAVMSDVHYPGALDAPEVARFETALKFMNEYSAAQSYSRFDALVVAGDMSNAGVDGQLIPFRNSMDKFLAPDTQRVLCMGNHEFYGGNRAVWEKTFNRNANSRQEINGFQFITLSCQRGSMRSGDYLYALDWLKAELDAAVAADPKKPVFLAQHYHVANTVYGSCPPDNWGVTDLSELLKNYPTVVDFSGHSHYPTNDPRSAWQGEYTAFGTGTLSYYEMSRGKYNPFPEGYRNAAEFYLMEVHRDMSIVLKIYDVITQSFYDMVYVIAQPGNIDKYIYTNKRFETSKAPVWKNDSKVSIVKATPQGAEIQFPQAQFDGPENIVHSYHFNFQRKAVNSQTGEETWTEAAQTYDWSKYYFRNMPETLNYAANFLGSESDYKVSITALNCFGKESTSAIEGFFTTLTNPLDCVDKKAPAPQANLLDVHFTSDGPVNTAVNRLPSQKAVERVGAPSFIADAALSGAAAATFDGEKDALKIPFTAEDYAAMRSEITMAAKFKIDKFIARNSDVFANTENGGYCFEVNGASKILELWCNIGGGYKIVRAPINEGEYITAFGVYDSTALILYINGKEAGRTPASGLINYPGGKARAFCIGSDVTGSGGSSNFFKGSVAFARLYSWALTPEQIQNLSK